jgi:hypothetical protein
VVRHVVNNLFYIDISATFLPRKITKIIHSYIKHLINQTTVFGNFPGKDGTVGRCRRAAQVIWAAIFTAFVPLKAGGVWPANPLIAGRILRGAAAVAEQPVVSGQ